MEGTDFRAEAPPFCRQIGTIRYWNLRGKPAATPLIEDAPPVLREIGPATLTPRRYPPKQAGPRHGAVRVIEGGIYDGEGRLLPIFAEREAHDERAQAGNRLRNDPRFDSERFPVQRRLVGPHVYLGLLRGHFGHFLLESLCRLWYLLRPDPGVQLLFHGEHGPDALPSFARHVFDLLEIDASRVTVLDEVATVEHLLIPDSAFEIRWKARPAHADAFRELHDRNRARHGSPTLPERVYLTRRQLDTSDEAARRKRVANEGRVERIFTKRGYTVVAPETLPFAEQIALAGQARALAGLKGSALHMSLFSQRADAQLIQIDKRQSANQSLIDALKGMEAHHIICKQAQEEGGFLVDVEPLRRVLRAL